MEIQISVQEHKSKWEINIVKQYNFTDRDVPNKDIALTLYIHRKIVGLLFNLQTTWTDEAVAPEKDQKHAMTTMLFPAMAATSNALLKLATLAREALPPPWTHAAILEETAKCKYC